MVNDVLVLVLALVWWRLCCCSALYTILFRDVLDGEKVVAAGTLRSDESSVTGQDGRSYKSRSDTVEVDEELTRALHVSRDPIMPLVDEFKQSGESSDRKLLHKQRKKYTPQKSNLKRDTRTAPARIQ